MTVYWCQIGSSRRLWLIAQAAYQCLLCYSPLMNFLSLTPTCIAPCTHSQTIQSHSCQNTSMACPTLSDWFNYNNFISSSIIHHLLALFWKCWFIYMSFLPKETALYLRDATFFYSPFIIFQRINSCMQINDQWCFSLRFCSAPPQMFVQVCVECCPRQPIPGTQVFCMWAWCGS